MIESCGTSGLASFFDPHDLIAHGNAPVDHSYAVGHLVTLPPVQSLMDVSLPP
jgi:hypothetical protein